MLVSKKQKTEQWLFNHPELKLQCIHCQKLLRYDNGSLKCINGHSFDITKQGYFNLAKTSSNTQYMHELFTVRRRIIMSSNFYDPLHEKLREIIKSNKIQTILDAGSGEGSHLFRLLQEIPNVIGVGVDLSKEGIRLATDYNDIQLSLVADLSRLPIMNQSMDCILSILSPSNYDEFFRVMSSDGLMIKVIPNEKYLIEIRQTMAKLSLKEYHAYENYDVVNVFSKHFDEYHTDHIYRKVPLSLEEKFAITKMTPLTWSLSEIEQEAVANNLPDEITLDLLILYNC